TGAIDAAVATRVAEVRPPTSIVWSLIGALQYIVTAGLLFAGLWIAAVFFLHAPFASVDVPVLGPIPTPLMVLAALLLAGYVLARFLGMHAGILGRRWARRLRGDLTRELETRLGDLLFARLDGRWHRQTSDEFLLVLEGELVVEFDAGPLSAGPGEAILIAAGERHRAEVPADCLLLSVEGVAMERTDG